MGGKIDCYVDVVSWYSYIAFVELLANGQKLASHGVEIEFHPVFLGGIMNATGNRPPWMLPARGKYTSRETLRVASRAGLPHIRFPPNFMARSNSVPALRALHFVKAKYPTAVFLTTLRFFFHAFWTPPHTEVSNADSVADILRSCPAAFNEAGELGEGKLFTETDVAGIMAGAAGEMKDSVRKETDAVVAQGAFGAPWMCVKNRQGKEDFFFGSDRFVYVYDHLGLPVRGVELLEAGGTGSTKL